MSNYKILLLLAVVVCYIWSSTSAVPLFGGADKLRASSFKLNRNYGSDYKRTTGTCEDIVTRDFADQVAMAFFRTGNIIKLDKLLQDLVELKCYTKEETDEFRQDLVTIYNLFAKNKVEKKRFIETNTMNWENNDDDLRTEFSS